MTYDDYLEKARGKICNVYYETGYGRETHVSGKLLNYCSENIVLRHFEKETTFCIPLDRIKCIIPITIDRKGDRKELVIETNLMIGKNNAVVDHQSRIIQVESWDSYCKAYKEYKGEGVYFESETLSGYSLLSNCEISNLQIDTVHLSCDITKYTGDKELFTDKRLAYRVFYPIPE